MIRVLTLRLYERPLAEPPAAPAPPPGIEVEMWGVPGTDQPGTRWHPEAAERFREGQVCAVARVGPDVVAYCWVTTAPVSVVEIDRMLIPGAGEAYFYDAYTAPAFRGRGLFTAVLLRLQAYARAAGRRRALIFVLASNIPSWRAIERAGFAMFQTVTKIEVLGLAHVRYGGPRSGRARVSLIPAR